ncbi:MAG: cupredoxin domain-containing protein [Actinomycetia bacterium]|nr:cupredoxin domain-containing protein [Actinomycetes bacterium]
MDTPTSTLNPATVSRLSAAIALLVGGLVHLQLYFDGYRHLPDANLGRSFVANGVASVLIAAALVVRRDALVRLAGIGVALGTLGAFAMSRRGDGVFGLRETGLNPSPQALIALIAEVAAIAALAFSFLPKVGGGNTIDRRLGVPAAGIFAVGAVVLSVLWAQDSGASATTNTPGTVSMSDFAFHESEVFVTAGSDVTWTNGDGFAHSIVATDGAFHSDSLGTGESFTTTFDTAGTFAYVCGIHGSMTGTVVVTG